MNFLTVIIKYNDKINELYRTLDSIERLKMHKEIESIVISNGSNLKKEIVTKYRHTVTIISARNKMGALYQEALDKSNSVYVTFLNSKDSFVLDGTLKAIDILKKEQPNILKTNFSERYLELNGEIKIGNLDTGMIETIRSYFFKVEFLKNQDYRFDKNIDHFVEEDFYRKVFLTTNYSIYSVQTCFSDYSIVRIKENMLSIYSENIDELYYSMNKCLGFLFERESPSSKLFIARIIMTLYVIVCSYEFSKPTLKEKKEHYEKIIFDYYKKYNVEFSSFNEQQLAQILKIEFERQRRNNINLSLVESFRNMLDRLKSKYEDRNNSNYLLDIIVPEYNGEKNVLNFLNSLSEQKNVDFSEIGIIIVDDFSPNELNYYKFKKYCNLNIKFVKNNKNFGPGLTRQHGIDESKADFVTFFDCDDEFYDQTSFSKMLVFLKEHNPDIAKGSFAEELPSGKTRIYRPTDASQFLHGMYFKRHFLVDNNYRFNSRIRIAEDSYFTTIVLSDNPAYLFDYIVYLWKFNRNSLVRVDNSAEVFHQKNIMDIIYSGYDSVKFLENKKSTSICKVAINSVLLPYLLLTSYVFRDYDNSLLRKYEYETYKMYVEFKKYFEITSKEDFDKYLLMIVKSSDRSMPGIKPLESFDDFIARMAKEYPDL